MSKRGENIYKRKDGRWEGRFPRGRKIDGKLKYGYIYGSTYQEVRQKLYGQKQINKLSINLEVKALLHLMNG